MKGNETEIFFTRLPWKNKQQFAEIFFIHSLGGRS